MRILIVTQAVDQANPVLGFFHEWIAALADTVEKIEVICLEEGRHALPKKVRVHSLGKERGRRSRLGRAFRFLATAWRLRRGYDAVFVHMNEEYPIIAGWLWRLFGKRVVLWRNHPAGTWRTDIAVWFSDIVCYTSPSAYVARFPHAQAMPVGIDTDRFSPGPPAPRGSILFLGRLDTIKRPDVFLEAMRRLKDTHPEAHANVVGSPTPGREAYAEELKRMYGDLPNVTFLPGVPNEEAARLYRAHAIYVNLTPSGSFDKTIGEALASGALVIAANGAVADRLGEFSLTDATPEALAATLSRALSLSPGEFVEHGARGRSYIVQEHSFILLVKRLSALLSAAQQDSVAFMLNALGYGGAERVFMSDMHAFAESGYRVTLLTLYQKPVPEDLKIAQGIEHIELRAKHPFDLGAVMRSVRALRAARASVLISTLNDGNILARWTRLILGKGLRLIMREANDPLASKTWWQRLLDRALARVPSHVVAVSSAAYAATPERLRKSGRVTYLPNAVALGTPDSHREEDTILCVGRLTQQKGHEVLLQALRLLYERNVPFNVRIIGQGELEEGLRRLCAHLGLNGRVTFVGALPHPEVLREYARASVFALPSLWEGSPNVVLEAMAHGMPVVASRISGVTDLLEDGKTGLLVPAGNPSALAEGLESLLTDRTLRNRLGQAARAHIRDTYSPERRFSTLRAIVSPA